MNITDPVSTSDNQLVACIARFDNSGRFTFVNDCCRAITGRARDELLAGMDMRTSTCPDDLPRNADLLGSLFATGEPFAIEKRVVRTDGSTAWGVEVTPH